MKVLTFYTENSSDFCLAPICLAQKAFSVASNCAFLMYLVTKKEEGLYDVEILRECTVDRSSAGPSRGFHGPCSYVHYMMDVFFKRLIRSCIELVGARSALKRKKHQLN